MTFKKSRLSNKGIKNKGKHRDIKDNKKRVVIFITLIILLILSFILRLWPLQIYHWWDETVYLQNAEVIFSGRTNYNEFYLRPPLISLIFAGGYLFYHSVYTAEVIVALMGTLSVYFIYLIGKEWYNQEIGLLSAIFLGLSPMFVEASHWIMTSTSSLTFAMIAFYLSIIALKKKSRTYILLSGVLMGISFLTRFTSI
ncbi:MAG: hypothetical protein GWP09_02150, partial [Nitrospiraceae bacterium]|nr:hypothetical protein [Nitrospiraceae bacterium]